MKFTLKFAVEIKRSRPDQCDRTHADEPPADLAPVTDARLDLARAGWDHDQRSPAVAARFGFGPPASSCTPEATS